MQLRVLRSWYDAVIVCNIIMFWQIFRDWFLSSIELTALFDGLTTLFSEPCCVTIRMTNFYFIGKKFMLLNAADDRSLRYTTARQLFKFG